LGIKDDATHVVAFPGPHAIDDGHARRNSIGSKSLQTLATDQKVASRDESCVELHRDRYSYEPETATVHLITRINKSFGDRSRAKGEL
jgi:hypothetical protein